MENNIIIKDGNPIVTEDLEKYENLIQEYDRLVSNNEDNTEYFDEIQDQIEEIRERGKTVELEEFKKTRLEYSFTINDKNEPILNEDLEEYNNLIQEYDRLRSNVDVDISLEDEKEILSKLEEIRTRGKLTQIRSEEQKKMIEQSDKIVKIINDVESIDQLVDEINIASIIPETKKEIVNRFENILKNLPYAEVLPEKQQEELRKASKKFNEMIEKDNELNINEGLGEENVDNDFSIPSDDDLEDKKTDEISDEVNVDNDSEKDLPDFHELGLTDSYEILGINKDATLEEIEDAYNKKVEKYNNQELIDKYGNKVWEILAHFKTAFEKIKLNLNDIPNKISVEDDIDNAVEKDLPDFHELDLTDPYEILGINKDATLEEIEDAYNKKDKKYVDFIKEPGNMEKFDLVDKVRKHIENAKNKAIEFSKIKPKEPGKELIPIDNTPVPIPVETIGKGKINKNKLKKFLIGLSGGVLGFAAGFALPGVGKFVTMIGATIVKTVANKTLKNREKAQNELIQEMLKENAIKGINGLTQEQTQELNEKKSYFKSDEFLKDLSLFAESVNIGAMVGGLASSLVPDKIIADTITPQPQPPVPPQPPTPDLIQAGDTLEGLDLSKGARTAFDAINGGNVPLDQSIMTQDGNYIERIVEGVADIRNKYGQPLAWIDVDTLQGATNTVSAGKVM